MAGHRVVEVAPVPGGAPSVPGGAPGPARGRPPAPRGAPRRAGRAPSRGRDLRPRPGPLRRGCPRRVAHGGLGGGGPRLAHAEEPLLPGRAHREGARGERRRGLGRHLGEGGAHRARLPGLGRRATGPRGARREGAGARRRARPPPPVRARLVHPRGPRRRASPAAAHGDRGRTGRPPGRRGNRPWRRSWGPTGRGGRAGCARSSRTTPCARSGTATTS